MRLVIVSSSNDLKYVKNIKGKKYIVSGYTAVSNYFKKNNYFCNDLNTRIQDLKKKNYHKLLLEYNQIFEKKSESYTLFRKKNFENYVGFFLFSKILKKIIKEQKITKIILLSSIEEKFNNDKLLLEILIRIIKSYGLDIKNINSKKDFQLNKDLLIKQFNFLKETLFNIHINFRIKDNKKDNICLLDNNKLGIKKLKYFLTHKYNIFYFNQINNFLNFEINYDKITIKNSKKKVSEIFKDYFINFVKYNKDIIEKEKNNFNKFAKKNNIKKIAWYFSPTEVNIFPILINEGFKKNIKVMGFQHGGLYGVISKNNPTYSLHKICDFNFCDIFYSYSFFKLKSDKYNIRKKNPKIKQLKYFDDYKIKTVEKKILYIPQIIENLFSPRVNITSDKFYKKQKEIINVLCHGLDKEYQSHIKSYNGINENYIESYYPIIPYITSKLNKNLKITKEKSVIEFIKKEKPSIVILDYISTPLWEVIKLPVNIFILQNSELYLNKYYHNLIKNRVTFFKNEEELRENIYKTNYQIKINNKKIKKFIL